MSAVVRPETVDDEQAIETVHLAAFPTSAEARLVRMLRDDSACELSYVAEVDGRPGGHVMLSRMQVAGDGRTYRAVGLGPVAVLPEHQRRGIGSALISKVLQAAEAQGEELVFVLGDPDYYDRFGFSAQAAAPFDSPYAGPHFMAKAFVPVSTGGTAAYAAAFSSL